MKWLKWLKRKIEFFPLLLFRCAARLAIYYEFPIRDLVSELWELANNEDRRELDTYLFSDRDDEKILNYHTYYKKQERNFR